MAETCVLFNQSYHMTDLYLDGPDALRLLSHHGVNSFKGFEPGKAKQFVACNYDGYVIGDAILFFLEKDLFNLGGRPSIHIPKSHALLTQKAGARLRQNAPLDEGAQPVSLISWANLSAP